ncbi:response regulator transcription factor [soil metagenome]
MIRLILVDDHPIVLGGLEAALEPHTDLEVVGRAGSVAEARALLDQQHADVALVDVRLPDGTGFALLEEAIAPPATAIIMLTTFHTGQYLAAAMRLGARGYLLKTSPIEEIVDAVHRVAGGGVAFMTGGEAVSEPTQPLSAQEAQIVRAVAAGLTNKEIAAQLAISRRTVEWHLAKLFERLAVRSRSELAVRAALEGWLDLT